MFGAASFDQVASRLVHRVWCIAFGASRLVHRVARRFAPRVARSRILFHLQLSPITSVVVPRNPPRQSMHVLQPRVHPKPPRRWKHMRSVPRNEYIMFAVAVLGGYHGTHSPRLDGFDRDVLGCGVANFARNSLHHKLPAPLLGKILRFLERLEERHLGDVLASLDVVSDYGGDDGVVIHKVEHRGGGVEGVENGVSEGGGGGDGEVDVDEGLEGRSANEGGAEGGIADEGVRSVATDEVLARDAGRRG